MSRNAQIALLRSSRAKITAGVFAGLALLLLYFHGQRMLLTNDEGIILDAAQRMAHGQRPYVDFFGYMSPGSYWMQALVFQLGGLALWTGRLLVILDVSLQAALVFWLADRLSTRKTAIAACLACAGFQIADPRFLTAAHRWDSATLAVAGLSLAAWALDQRAGWPWYAAGALFGAAAWCTPSVAVAGVVAGLWLLLSRERRRHLPAMVAGGALVLLAGVALLAATGSLAGFVHQMQWLSKNYAAVNIMPYGSIIGGYAALFDDAHGALELAIRALLVTCIAVPAILPLAALLLGSFSLWRGRIPEPDRAILLLLTLTVPALVLTTFPRADVAHLAFIAAVPYAVTAVCLSRLIPQPAAPFAGLTALLLAALLASNHFVSWSKTLPVPSPVGMLRVEPELADGMAHLLTRVHPGDSLFIHPYLPVGYFLTQARNPTTFSYLQPSMMTGENGDTALDQLRQDPPQWLLFLELSAKEYQRVFPSSAGLSWRFDTLEGWITDHYQPVEDPAVNIGGYRLWKRNAAISAN